MRFSITCASRKKSCPRSGLPCRSLDRFQGDAAEATGLKKGTPVVAGGSDATVESLSIGLIRPSQCKIRLGTAGALVTVIDDLDLVEKGKYYVWSYLVPGKWMLDNNTRSCAQATAWFRSVFLAEEESSDAAYERIAREAADVPPGAEGLYFHPYLLGEDSPYWDSRLRGSFFGFQAGHTALSLRALGIRRHRLRPAGRAVGIRKNRRRLFGVHHGRRRHEERRVDFDHCGRSRCRREDEVIRLLKVVGYNIEKDVTFIPVSRLQR